MFSKTEFIVQLKRANLTQKSLANAMGIAVSTLNKKIQSGHFTREDMAKLIEILKIESPTRFYEIFFCPELA